MNGSPPDPPLLARQLTELLPEEFQKPLEQWEEEARERVRVSRLLRQCHAEGQRALIAKGKPREQVEAMPFIQVALLQGLKEYDRLMDDYRKWEGFPFWEARPQLQRLAAVAKQEVKGEGRILPLHLFPPGVDKIFQARAHLDRKVAALRCLEAIRLYAAAHGGRLPATLGAIQEVPIPRDPMTGKEFEYHVEGERARLYGPPPEGEGAHAGNTLCYEVRLKR
jgi:hypothetical protein